MAWSHGKSWSKKEVASALISASERFGRMPSASELREKNLGSLADAVPRYGGYRYWAKILGLDVKDSETQMGQDWEQYELSFFKKSGFFVERQTTKCGFDLSVNGVEVDVKAANLYKCPQWSGYAFAGLKRGTACQVFDFLVLKGQKVAHRFLVPAKEIKNVTLTLTIGQIAKGRFCQYDNNLSVFKCLKS